ncbi:MAG: hypothetical protein EXR29_13260 [Betaproteobacteria bacterium]|nr:hypothetical protein [Betaproteobacteria bacterium]
MKPAAFLFVCVCSFLAVLASPAGAQTVVRAGALGISADGPVYIAIEKGYFREQGIEVKLENFAGGAQAMAPLSAGQLDVTPSSGITPALFNAFARGLPLRIVGPNSIDLEGGNVLMVRNDLKGQIQRFSNLKGSKIAVNTAGSALLYMIGKMLESDGLSIKDVEIVYMPFPDMGTAFQNKAIAAATEVEPFITLFQDRGLAYAWKSAADTIRNPHFQVAVVIYNSDWAQKNPAAAQGFMTAYLKGSRDFVDAAKGGKIRSEVVDILIKHTRVKDKALYDRMRWPHPDPNGVVVKESLRDQQDWHAKDGTVPKKVDIDAIVDDRYVKHSIQQLGLYK